MWSSNVRNFKSDWRNVGAAAAATVAAALAYAVNTRPTTMHAMYR